MRSTATVTVTVTPVDDPAVAIDDDGLSLAEDSGSVTIDVLAESATAVPGTPHTTEPIPNATASAPTRPYASNTPS